LFHLDNNACYCWRHINNIKFLPKFHEKSTGIGFFNEYELDNDDPLGLGDSTEVGCKKIQTKKKKVIS
jgi:hypothetical protein